MELTLQHFKELNFRLLNSQKRMVVGFSGGVDSSVLLHLIVQCLSSDHILVFHVNHKLQDAADSMEMFCRTIAQQYQIPIKIATIDLSRQKSNVEAVARQARYDAFKAELSCERDVLLTGHHANDQLETLWLNLLRGTGVKGLRGVSRQLDLAGLECQRPLLPFTRAAIDAYARQHQLKWQEDDSNLDEHFDRNFLRHRLTPLLKDRWSSIEYSFQQVSEHQQEAYECMQALAEIDFASSQTRSSFSDSQVLSLDVLKQLSDARAKNVLRYWSNLLAIKLTQNQLNKLSYLVFSASEGLKKVILKVGFFAFYQGQLFWVDNKKIRKYKIKLEGNNHLGMEFSRHTAQQLGMSTHHMKRLFQHYKVPPWLRDHVVFYN